MLLASHMLMLHLQYVAYKNRFLLLEIRKFHAVTFFGTFICKDSTPQGQA